MKVNAIESYNRINNINFESKKSSKKEPPSHHTTVPIKAVPVIVLMAMSPLNAPISTAQSTQATKPQTEVVTNNEKVLASYIIKNASPKYGDCTMDLISTDGNDTNIEKVALKFKNTSDHKEKHYANIYDLQSLSQYKNGYGISGPGKCKSVYYDNYGNIVGVTNSDENIVNVRITKEFFDFMHQTFGENLTCEINESKIMPFD